MKKLIKYLFIMFAGSILFTSCEEKDTGYEFTSLADLPNKGTVLFSSVARTLQFDIPAPGDGYENKEFDIYIRVVGPPPAENLTVNFEIDAASTAVLGTHFSLSASSFTIEAGKLNGVITVTTLQENCELDTPYHIFMNLSRTSSTNYAVHNIATEFDGRIFKPCFVDILAFVGGFEVAYQGDDPDPDWVCTLTTYDLDEFLIKLDGIWLSTDELILQVNLDETIVDPYEGDEGYAGQFIGVFSEDLGRVRFEDINGGKILNTCNGEFEFLATPTLPDSGFWWGGEKHFRLVPSGGKGGYKLEVIGGSLEQPVKR